MISISSFYPFSNLARVSFEFCDEKIIFKTKSLTVDNEGEIKYEKIKVIKRKRLIDLRWVGTASWVIGLIGVFYFIFNWPHSSNSTILFIEKLLAILGLLLCIPAFRKREICSFLDSDRNPLATIEVKTNNRKLFEDAIYLIKQKTEIISETNLTNPLADTRPIFEITSWDIPDFLNKSVTRFYDDRFVDSEQSLLEEMVTEVKYCELRGKPKSIKAGNQLWSSLGCFLLGLCTAIITLFALFFPQLTKGIPIYLYLGWVILSILMFVLRYAKKEVLVFYNKNDQEIWWTRPNASNRKKIDQIVEFIQNKTASSSEN
jgi:hypothetical protein